MILKNDGKRRGAHEETQLPVSGIEINCIYFLYRQGIIKVVYERKLNSVEKQLLFQKTRVFILRKFY